MLGVARCQPSLACALSGPRLSRAATAAESFIPRPGRTRQASLCGGGCSLCGADRRHATPALPSSCGAALSWELDLLLQTSCVLVNETDGCLLEAMLLGVLVFHVVSTVGSERNFGGRACWANQQHLHDDVQRVRGVLVVVLWWSRFTSRSVQDRSERKQKCCDDELE